MLLTKNIQQNPALEMIMLKKLIPHLSIELRYATDNNFLNQKLYTEQAEPICENLLLRHLQRFKKSTDKRFGFENF